MRDRVRMPRRIHPEQVEIGDEVEVVFKRERGIEFTHKGIVAKEMINGTRHDMLTAEGATIFSWTAGKNDLVRVVLHSKEIKNAEPLFSDLMNEIRDRIA